MEKKLFKYLLKEQAQATFDSPDGIGTAAACVLLLGKHFTCHLLFILYHHSKWNFKVSEEYGKNCATNFVHKRSTIAFSNQVLLS